MQARPRYITTLLAISAATFVVGCGENSDTEDPLAAVSEQYRTLLRERPVIREQPDATDDTAETLRQLAGRAQSAGREGDEQAAAILTAGIRSTAATLEYDEAMRAESQASALRDLVRALAADADRLATTAANAEQLDIGETTIVLESELARAREAFNAADSELEELRSQTELAASERDELLAVAAEYDETANESAEVAVELDPIDARDYWIDASHFRGEAHKARVAAALSDISIQTIAPTMVLADARRAGQSEVIDAAREARRAAENRVDEARSFAADVRDLVDQLATAAADRLARVEELETTQIMPRLEASIGDFDAAASAARALTRGGSREDAAAGWRSIANAQFGAGRAQWEIATIQGRRADLFGRLAAGGGFASSSSGGGATAGFGTPAEVANFLSDGSNMLLPSAFARLDAALQADTPAGQSVKKLLTSAGFAAPMISALIDRFGEDAVMASMAEDGAGGGLAVGPDMATSFSVDSVDGDTATLKSEDGSQTLVLLKTGSGWVIDLDETVEGDPNMKMMVQMMGPMMEQMLAPMKQAVDAVTKRVEAGEFSSLDEAIAAIEESMDAAQPQGLPGGF